MFVSLSCFAFFVRKISSNLLIGSLVLKTCRSLFFFKLLMLFRSPSLSVIQDHLSLFRIFCFFWQRAEFMVTVIILEVQVLKRKSSPTPSHFQCCVSMIFWWHVGLVVYHIKDAHLAKISTFVSSVHRGFVKNSCGLPRCLYLPNVLLDQQWGVLPCSSSIVGIFVHGLVIFIFRPFNLQGVVSWGSIYLIPRSGTNWAWVGL